MATHTNRHLVDNIGITDLEVPHSFVEYICSNNSNEAKCWIRRFRSGGEETCVQVIAECSEV